MRTLIVPCGGRSSRFVNMRPKYLLTYPDGEIMVKKAISGIKLDIFNRIIITIVQEHCDKYEADLILKQALNIGDNSKIELCVLPVFTSCQSETVYETIKRMKVEGSVVIKDSDNYIEIDCLPDSNFIVGLNVNEFGKEILRLNSKSFLIINNQKIITDIIEKKIKSDYICVGMYGFKSADSFCSSYEQLSAEFDHSDSREIFISHVISFMIGVSSSIFEYIGTLQFEDWGTSKDWQIVQGKMKTYFIDFDGVIVKNCGKYGSKNWDNELIPIEENIITIKELYDDGAQIVVTTARDDKYRDLINAFFDKNGMKLHAIVTNCHHAARVLINDFAPSNPYPSCEAVSIPRDGSLKSYIKG